VKKILMAMALLSLVACAGSGNRADPPQFKVDPFWPKALPGNWMLGQVAGIAVDKDDNVWILHRPGTLLDDEKGALKNPPETKCCTPAPAVLQFDREGKLLRSWGGPGQGYDWFESEHGISVDPDGNVWVGGNSPKDHHLLQFTPDGKFIKQLGKPGKSEGSNSTTQLGRPAHMTVDGAANELYVADGYGNRRIIVFDAKTLAYKRHWGAYGDKPNDDKLPAYSPLAAMRAFQNPVHCVRLSNDGLVYVCDRQNDRIQVFEKGGKFVREIFVERETLQNGSVWDLVLSEDAAQKYIFVANGASGYLLIVDRQSGQTLGTFSRPGRMAGELRWVHNLAIDSKGNLYTAEVGFGRRAQKFVRQ
jgi:DNA-binding beta-propeller fold protein YncE